MRRSRFRMVALKSSLAVALGLALATSAVPAHSAPATANDPTAVASLGARTRAAPARNGIADVPVSFTVQNVNRSLIPCRADGATYVVSGHLIGPRAALRNGAAATLYLHGAAVPEATWRMPVRGYDFARQQASRGHVSVTIDRLSYGASQTP